MRWPRAVDSVRRRAPGVDASLSRERFADTDRWFWITSSLGSFTLVVYLATAIPTYGWAPFLLSGLTTLAAPLGRIGGRQVPERQYALGHAAWIVTFGVAAAMAGGAHSFVLPLIVAYTLGFFSRLGPRAATTYALSAYGLAIVPVLVSDWRGFVDSPWLLLSCTLGMLSMTIFAAQMAASELHQRGAATIDQLTGLLNRRGLEERMTELAQQAAVIGPDTPIAVIVADLDHFKVINDTNGHPRGDDVLRDVAYIMRTTLRRFELIYRVGGEEFLVVLPGHDASAAADAAELIRTALESGRPGGLHVTISMGVAASAAEGVDIRELPERCRRGALRREGRRSQPSRRRAGAARPGRWARSVRGDARLAPPPERATARGLRPAGVLGRRGRRCGVRAGLVEEPPHPERGRLQVLADDNDGARRTDRDGGDALAPVGVRRVQLVPLAAIRHGCWVEGHGQRELAQGRLLALLVHRVVRVGRAVDEAVLDEHEITFVEPTLEHELGDHVRARLEPVASAERAVSERLDPGRRRRLVLDVDGDQHPVHAVGQRAEHPPRRPRVLRAVRSDLDGRVLGDGLELVPDPGVELCDSPGQRNTVAQRLSHGAGRVDPSRVLRPVPHQADECTWSELEDVLQLRQRRDRSLPSGRPTSGLPERQRRDGDRRATLGQTLGQPVETEPLGLDCGPERLGEAFCRSRAVGRGSRVVRRRVHQGSTLTAGGGSSGRSCGTGARSCHRREPTPGPC